MTERVRAWLGSVSLGLLLPIGCSNKAEDRPPPSPFHGTPVNVMDCGQIRQGVLDGDRIAIDGGVAGCARGLSCPLGPAFDTRGLCGAFEQPFATCPVSEWVVECVDAGLPVDAASPEG